MNYEVKKQIRSIHKSIEQEIRLLKSQRKTQPNGYVHGLYDLQVEIRHRYLAYGILRGKTIEQIEPKTSDEWLSRRHESLINRYLGKYKELEASHE